MYNVLAVANTFLRNGKMSGIGIPPMSLNYLCFLAYGYCAGCTEKPLFHQEILVSNTGPRIMCLYEEFKNFGSFAITRYAEMQEDENKFIDVSDEDSNFIINEIWRQYKHYNPMELSMLCHNETSLWYKLNSELKSAFSFEDMKEFYKKLITKNGADVQC